MTSSATSLNGFRDTSTGSQLPFGPVPIDRLIESIRSGAIDAVLLVTPDNAGRCLGERVPGARILQAIDDPLAIRVPLMLWGIDIEQNVRAGLVHVGGMAAGVPDVPLVPDLSTARLLPWLPRTPVIICDPADAEGRPLDIAPRQMLKRQLARLEALGVQLQAATELEFNLFTESYEDAWRNGYTTLTPSSRYHAAYDALEALKSEAFIDAVISQMDQAGIEVEGYANEYGRGQHEINLKHTTALEMADRHFLYKFGVKSIATRLGVSATFMAKWMIGDEGNSCHVHVSLWDADTTAPLGEDKRFDAFVGGVAAHMAESTLMYAPHINSYRRFRPHSFAPTTIAVGDNNRTCSLRVVGLGKHRRVENRVPGADVNPYVALAAVALGGAGGIETEAAMPHLETGDVYSRTDLPMLPTSLPAALSLFENSKAVRDGLGTEAHHHLLAVGREEEIAFLSETVTDWERRRLFERG
ncbi:glutamine synthetase family protein [Dactylosporangium sp. CA-233914]|uniref:glutamine synthetase family protein n=1 Tax=Dactylosporangium sp. CA-233914 TaxID=3239934 RepID=UPI003D8E671A